MPGYREEVGVDPHSQTETYVALRLHGRQLAVGGRAVLRPHRQAPAQAGHRGRDASSTGRRTCRSRRARPRARARRARAAHPARRGHHPALRRQGARPGVPGAVGLDGLLLRRRLPRGDARGLRAPPARRARRRPDAVHPQPTRSSRRGASSTPSSRAWADERAPLARYDAGSWGPPEADELLARDGRRWRRP